MEFWGVEVKPGETVKCEPGEDRFLHLSQAAIGESKAKGVESAPIYVKFNDQKLVLGTLSAENCAQISYDLVFEKEFELSHGSKNASVYFCGYKSYQEEEEMSDDEMFDFDSEEEEEDVQIAPNVNGKPKAKALGGKPAAVKSNVDKEDNAVGKPKAKTGGPIKAEPKADDEDDKSDDEDDDDDDSEGSDDDEDMLEAMGDSDDEDSDDEDEDEEDSGSSEEEDEATPTPKKAFANGKKRPAESASKTPVPEKKAKLVTPAGQKTGGDGKKNAHVATPHPAKQAGKQAGKAPANSDKAKQQTPKSSGSVTCKSCNKSFNSENALESHTKAKHSAAK